MFFSVFPLFLLNSCYPMFSPVFLCLRGFSLFSYIWAPDPVISRAGINADETLLKPSLGVLWSPHEHFIPQFIVRHLWRPSTNVVTCSQLTFFTLEQVQVNERC